MELDPQLVPLLELSNAAVEAAPPVSEQTPEQLRTAYRAQGAWTPPGPELAVVRDLEVPGGEGKVPARLYGPTDTPAQLPLVVYFHGGGFVIGDLDGHDAVCRTLADRTGAAVLSVDYRLAPEHPHPAALEDCLAAVRWAAGHHDRVAVAGDSAGGTLAATVARRLHEAGDVELVGQLLIYPVCDWALESPSIDENASGYILSRDMMHWFRGHLFTDPSQWLDPDASPMRALSLEGLPPAMVITAGFDPLRDEGDAYAERLAREGVVTEHLRYPGQIHGFASMLGLVDQASECHDAIAEWLRPLLFPES